MTEFEPCPITGQRPLVRRLSDDADTVEALMNDPFGTTFSLRLRWIHDWQFSVWYNQHYIPAARKYAELLESQKPVEFLVGDEVGPSLLAYERYSTGEGKFLCQRATIRHGNNCNNFILDRVMHSGVDWWTGEELRLISRPKKLTVADLPEQDAVQVAREPDSDWWFSVDGLYRASFRTEHEAVQAAIDFCNKIADAVIAKREAGDA